MQDRRRSNVECPLPRLLSSLDAPFSQCEAQQSTIQQLVEKSEGNENVPAPPTNQHAMPSDVGRNMSSLPECAAEVWQSSLHTWHELNSANQAYKHETSSPYRTRPPEPNCLCSLRKQALTLGTQFRLFNRSREPIGKRGKPYATYRLRKRNLHESRRHAHTQNLPR